MKNGFADDIRPRSTQPGSVPTSNVVDLRVARPVAETPRQPERPPVFANTPPNTPSPASSVPRMAAPRKPFSPSRPYGKAAKFAIVAILLVVPIVGIGVWRQLHQVKGEVLGTSTDGFAALVDAGKAMQDLNAGAAKTQFAQASASFQAAEQNLSGLGTIADVMRSVIPAAGKVRSGKALVKAGEDFAAAGTALTDVLQSFAQTNGATQKPFADIVNTAQPQLATATTALQAALVELQKVQVRDVPQAQQQAFAGLQQRVPELQNALQRLSGAATVLANIVGKHATQRYLVLFQNNLELRASGGFIGSVALVEVTDGAITKLTVPGGGAYDYKGQLQKKIIAPEPLHLVNPHWQLQDANWWPDFPTSAAKANWFLEQSGGPSVDGTIALTPDVVVDLLRATGPIDMTTTYGTTITADNFTQQIFQAVDANTERPKQIIADLMPQLLDRVFHARTTDAFGLLMAFDRAVESKQLLLSFSDVTQQKTVEALGWAGSVAQTDKDYLQVVDTNIGGGKTDGVVDETIRHEANINADGTVDVTVTVQRTHFGTANDPYTGTRNVDYVRFYVPQGSTLQSAAGFTQIDPHRFQLADADATVDPDIEKIEGRPVQDELTGTTTSVEFGKTVFGNWLGIDPGQSITATIVYRLPFRLHVATSFLRSHTDTYSLLVQQQPGTSRRVLTSYVTYPASWNVQWTTGGLTQQGNTLQTSLPLVGDQLFAAIFSPR